MTLSFFRKARAADHQSPAPTAGLFIPKDAAAVAVGADDVAVALAKGAAAAGQTVDIVRTGSRGMMWLEPLIEVATGSERHGFGPLEASDVGTLLKDGILRGLTPHLQSPPQVPRAGGQDRLACTPDPPHLRALRRHRSAVAGGLPRPRRLQRT
jgi:hypothetical protein